MSDRPLRFGLLASNRSDVAAWTEDIHRAELMGYSSVLVPDHLGQGMGPFTALAVAAQQSSELSIGPLMLGTDLRPPTVVYQELVTLAQLVPTRLEIGLGAGWLGADFDQAGVPMRPASERIQRLDETADLLKQMFANEQVSYTGQHLRLTDVRADPRPPATADVKWVMGGGGLKVLEVAARHADIISVSATLSSPDKNNGFGPSATWEKFEERSRWIEGRGGAARFEVQTLVFAAAVTPDSARFARLVVQHVLGLDPDEAMRSPLSLVGTTSEIVSKIMTCRDQLGISYFVLPADQMEAFEPAVAELAGR